MTRYFVGLGGNVGDEAAIVARFRRARELLGEAVASSRLYRTAPIGPDQPDYLNAAIAIDTPLVGEAVIDRVLAVEAACGRDRRGELRWGPRAIDLDILAGPASDLPRMIVPHPRLYARKFALAPLADLDAAYRPALDRVRDQRCDVVADRW